MTRTRKRTTKAAAGAGIAGLIVTAALWGSTTTTAQAKDEGVDDQVFTIGMTNEVDSFNPFNGIEAESYEAWALMYDYMISYSDKDMSPQPSLASLGTPVDDGLTWTFHIRDGVKWTDGEPLTAKDIAYTYNRILDGGPESASWGSYLISVTDITAPDDTTVVMKLKKPNATLPLLPMPIIPEHIWKDVPEDEVKTYSNEPKSEDQPVIGSGPFKLVEGAAGGSTYRFVRNDDYWGGKPNMSRGRHAGLQVRGHPRAGPQGRRDRLRRGRHAASDQGPAGAGGHHRAGRKLSRLRRSSPSTQGRSTSTPASRSATPTRPCSTRSSGSP